MFSGPPPAHINEAARGRPAGGKMQARFPGTTLAKNPMKRSIQPKHRAAQPYSADIRSVPTHAEIAALAESLWRKNGFPLGRDEETWLTAERQLSRLPDPAGAERDRSTIADPHLGFNGSGKDVMEELDERFPGPIPRETTSL
jgi:hypothetical protein